MKKCPKCGQELEEGYLFCFRCGCSIPPSEQTDLSGDKTQTANNTEAIPSADNNANKQENAETEKHNDNSESMNEQVSHTKESTPPKEAAKIRGGLKKIAVTKPQENPIASNSSVPNENIVLSDQKMTESQQPIVITAEPSNNQQEAGRETPTAEETNNASHLESAESDTSTNLASAQQVSDSFLSTTTVGSTQKKTHMNEKFIVFITAAFVFATSLGLDFLDSILAKDTGYGISKGKDAQSAESKNILDYRTAADYDLAIQDSVELENVSSTNSKDKAENKESKADRQSKENQSSKEDKTENDKLKSSEKTETVSSKEPKSEETVKSSNAIHTYDLIVDDCSWEEAKTKAKNAGGYLATMDSKEEWDTVVNQIFSEGKEGIQFKIGGKRSSTGDSYYWLDKNGEPYGAPINSSESWSVKNENWYPNEPSFNEEVDGIVYEELYLDMFKVSNTSQFALNDIPNQPLDIVPYFSGKLGYIVEYGNDLNVQSISSAEKDDSELYTANFNMKIRADHNVEAEQIGRIEKGDSVTIIRTETNSDKSLWGKLAGDGWVCISDNTEIYLNGPHN